MYKTINYIPIDYTQNYPFSRLQDTQLIEPANQNSKKVPKVAEPTNKKTNKKTLVTSVINSSMSHPFLGFTGVVCEARSVVFTDGVILFFILGMYIILSS